MARFGMLACFAIHATLARAERPARRVPPNAVPPQLRPNTGPIVLAQLESFFDPRRLHAAIPPDLLPGWDACLRESPAHGRLAVPTWGANTIRSEFAALTGIDRAALGLDWFNPYERFAQHPVRSLAWSLRAAGYRTVCLHPFDKRFYGRHRVMPMLGFEGVIGPEAFAPADRAGGYVTDAALARKAAEIIADAGPNLFLFVISVGNHGPWAADLSAPPPPDLADRPEAGPLGAYLAGLRTTDAFFPPVAAALRHGARPGLLLAYGDHQPSLPAAFAALGHTDSDTDYLLWSPDAAPGPARPLAVHDIPALLLDHLAAAQPAREMAR
jgi:phosphoglycerol transferase MdoB-like AlkP superfamily enzyme